MSREEAYKFDGQWEFDLELAFFNQFDFKSKSKFTRFIIRDFQTDEYEPYVEQVECINFLLKNQEILCERI